MTTQPHSASGDASPASFRMIGLDAALAAVEQFLGDTADAVNPGTPPGELLGYTVRYRAHLSGLAAACRDLARQRRLSASDQQ